MLDCFIYVAISMPGVVPPPPRFRAAIYFRPNAYPRGDFWEILNLAEPAAPRDGRGGVLKPQNSAVLLLTGVLGSC